jgi:hypothetical protein
MTYIFLKQLMFVGGAGFCFGAINTALYLQGRQVENKLFRIACNGLYVGGIYINLFCVFKLAQQIK